MTNTTSSAPSTDNILTGVALMLGFCLTAPLLDVAAKLASSSVPVGQAARFVVQCALMAPFIWGMGLSLRVARGQWLPLILRALLLLFALPWRRCRPSPYWGVFCRVCRRLICYPAQLRSLWCSSTNSAGYSRSFCFLHSCNARAVTPVAPCGPAIPYRPNRQFVLPTRLTAGSRLRL